MTPSWRSGSPISVNIPGISDPVTTFQAWKTAARVHTLPAAVVPVVVGSALAQSDGVFRWDVVPLCPGGRVGNPGGGQFRQRRLGCASGGRYRRAGRTTEDGRNWTDHGEADVGRSGGGAGDSRWRRYCARSDRRTDDPGHRRCVRCRDARLCRWPISVRVPRVRRGVRLPLLRRGGHGGQPVHL